ncbi:MAG: YceI family protein, partial [Gemmatimonadaceae bacterium]|nr:YceI family protein [Gemmatimonadaceae bacterium]
MLAATIDTRFEQRDTHLRSADFVDATTFPEISFRSTRMKGNRTRFQLAGDLTIRSTTREEPSMSTSRGAEKTPRAANGSCSAPPARSIERLWD